MTWTKYWTTPYALTNCLLFGRQYTDSCWKELGIGFSGVHFIIEKRIATVFRKEEEQEMFSTTLATLFQQNPKKAEEIIHRALEIQDTLYQLFEEKEIFSDIFFEKFIEKYSMYLPYFLGVAWAANALDPEKDSGILALLETARKSTEHFYSSAETFLDRYFSYIAEQEHIDNKEVLSALSDEEVLAYLKNKTLPPKETLQARYDFGLVSVNKTHIEILSGEAAKTMIETLGLTKKGDVEHMTEFKGQTAHKGKVTGKVRVVLNHSDSDLVEPGEILVTAMTRPEWVPAIKKCAAIVTDVGGMLCHAAIIARELDKPCVIGTKIATQVCKNGDFIEVNADRGIITTVTVS